MLFDYWQKRGHAVADEANKYLEEQEVKLEEAKAELEKQLKAKKPKKGEPVPEINAAEYRLLPRELIIKMIQLRVEEEDCNAGVIFDNLTSEYWADEKYAIGVISEAIPVQNVQVLMFNFKQEEYVDEASGEKQEVEVCTNIRYAQRHDPAFQAKKEKKQEEVKEATERQTPRPPKAQKNAGKGMNKKTQKSTEELDAAAVEAEAERQRKKAEAEAAALEAAEAKKDKIRPAEFSSEDKQKWREYAQTMTDFLGELVVKTITEKEENPEKEFGQRSISEINVEYNYTFLCEHLCTSVVAEPIWPDPDKEPLPPPVISSILKKPPNRTERNKITKFSIWTPNGEPGEDETLPPMVDT